MGLSGLGRRGASLGASAFVLLGEWARGRALGVFLAAPESQPGPGPAYYCRGSESRQASARRVLMAQAGARVARARCYCILPSMPLLADAVHADR